MGKENVCMRKEIRKRTLKGDKKKEKLELEKVDEEKKK